MTEQDNDYGSPYKDIMEMVDRAISPHRVTDDRSRDDSTVYRDREKSRPGSSQISNRGQSCLLKRSLMNG